MSVQQINIQTAQAKDVKPSGPAVANDVNKANEANDDSENNGDLFSSLLLMALLGIDRAGAEHPEDFSSSTEVMGNPDRGEDAISVISGGDTGHLNLTTGGTDLKPDIKDLHGTERIVPTASEGVKDIAGLFKEMGHREKSSGPVDIKDKHTPVGGSDVIAFSPGDLLKDSIVIDTNNNTHPFHTYIERASVVQQISREMAHTFQIGSNSAKIRLEPPELGEIYIEISVVDDTVNTFMSVEKPEVKEIIETSLGHLEEELRNQGLKVDQFTVEMNEGSSGDGFASGNRGEEAGTRKRAYRKPDDYIINHINTGSLAAINRGLISIFA